MYNITCYLGNTLTLVKRGCLCSSHFTAVLVVYPSVSTDGLVRNAGVCTTPMCETTREGYILRRASGQRSVKLSGKEEVGSGRGHALRLVSK